MTYVSRLGYYYMMKNMPTVQARAKELKLKGPISSTLLLAFCLAYSYDFGIFVHGLCL